ncbi:hypothetical protein [Nocardioides flavescens]|uniref:Uncharacterized protein n=1 Tax=Nocardioides flavescens TaxID=2691959 RepID=A0A6L7ES46_9ACTN|nr:hypothetical protein [Nocardioides flavescens]MXG89500.1 hypothetical protein [Nocardioides flavescens]
MPHLDHEGTALLHRIQALEGADVARDVAPTSGRDEAERLEITVDAARRVTRVVVLDPSGLRTPERLQTAAREALRAADGARLLASLTASGTAQAWLEKADALRRGEVRPDPGRRPDVSRAASVQRRLRKSARGDAPRSVPPPPVVGVSDNGYLRVTRSGTGELHRLEVDLEWLQAADTGRLADALTQAMSGSPASRTTAYRGHDGTTA